MILHLFLIFTVQAFAGETWVIGSSPAARAVAMGLSSERVVEHEAFDARAAALSRPQFLVHEGAVSAADAARLLVIKTLSRVKLVNLGDPRERRQDWDLILSPRFEPPVPGRNTLRIDEWPTPIELRSHVWPERQVPLQIRQLPRPSVAVVLPGPRDGFTFTSDHAKNLGEMLRAFARANKGSIFVMIEKSATEPAVRSFMTTLTGVPAYFAARGDREAEYKILTAADQIVIAGGSIDALAAAMATDKPIYLYSPKSTVGERFKRYSLAGLHSGRVLPVGELKNVAAHFPKSTTTALLIERVRQKLGCEPELLGSSERR